MRLRTFTAATMPKAMELVRKDMGDDAIIVASEQEHEDSTYTVTAVIEDAPDIDDEIPPSKDDVVSINPQTQLSFLRQVLLAHGLPQHVLELLLRSADTFVNTDATMALAAAIDDRVNFHQSTLINNPHQSCL